MEECCDNKTIIIITNNQTYNKRRAINFVRRLKTPSGQNGQ